MGKSIFKLYILHAVFHFELNESSGSLKVLLDMG